MLRVERLGELKRTPRSRIPARFDRQRRNLFFHQFCHVDRSGDISRYSQLLNALTAQSLVSPITSHYSLLSRPPAAVYLSHRSPAAAGRRRMTVASLDHVNRRLHRCPRSGGGSVLPSTSPGRGRELLRPQLLHSPITSHQSHLTDPRSIGLLRKKNNSPGPYRSHLHRGASVAIVTPVTCVAFQPLPESALIANEDFL